MRMQAEQGGETTPRSPSSLLMVHSDDRCDLHFVLFSRDVFLELAKTAVDGDKFGLLGLDLLETRSQDRDACVECQEVFAGLLESAGHCRHELASRWE